MHDTVMKSLAEDDAIDKQTFSRIARAMMAYARVKDDSAASKVFDHASLASSSKFASFQIAIASYVISCLLHIIGQTSSLSMVGPKGEM